MLQVTNKNGRRFNVRIVLQGGQYGLRDCLTNNKRKTLVEFYDAHAVTGTFENRGQFISRYRLETLLGRDSQGVPVGICLDGNEPHVWHVSGRNVSEAIRYAICTEGQRREALPAS